MFSELSEPVKDLRLPQETQDPFWLGALKNTLHRFAPFQVLLSALFGLSTIENEVFHGQSYLTTLTDGWVLCHHHVPMCHQGMANPQTDHSCGFSSCHVLVINSFAN